MPHARAGMDRPPAPDLFGKTSPVSESGDTRSLGWSRSCTADRQTATDMTRVA